MQFPMPLLCQPDTIDTKGESTETAIDEIVRMAVSQKLSVKRRCDFQRRRTYIASKSTDSVIPAVKEQNIHICIDTNGSIWNEEVEELLKWTDLVLLDIKEFNNASSATDRT